MRKSLLVGAVALVVGGATAVAEPMDADDGAKKKAPEAASVFFDTDSATIDSTVASQELDDLAKFAKCHRSDAIVLEGYADPRGTSAYNADLSARRAASVRESLMALGVAPEQIVLELYGETRAKGKPLSQDRRVTARIAGDNLKVPQGG